MLRAFVPVTAALLLPMAVGLLTALMFPSALLAEPGVLLGKSLNNMEGNRLTLQLSCGNKGYYPTTFGITTGDNSGQPTAGNVELKNYVSTYFYVKGTGIGTKADDYAMESLPAGHPGRAFGAKRWGDLWGHVPQPRYEIDILLTVENQPDPPVYFSTGTSYVITGLEKGEYRGTLVQSQTATVQRRHDTLFPNLDVGLVRFCELDSKETISVTITAAITAKRRL